MSQTDKQIIKQIDKQTNKLSISVVTFPSTPMTQTQDIFVRIYMAQPCSKTKTKKIEKEEEKNGQQASGRAQQEKEAHKQRRAKAKERNKAAQQ